MSRIAGKSKKFQEYLRGYDRTARGAGSEKDPAVDRFSGLDVRYVFQKGLDRGLSKEDAARDVLAYAAELEGRSKMGGATEAALDKLRGYLKDDVEEEKGDPLPIAPVGPAGPNIIPGTNPGQFGDPTRDTPGKFAGSYFDYLGTGETSDPRQFYMYGYEGPVGMARADRPVRVERYGVPSNVPSFLSDGAIPSDYQTESEYQEENRPDIGDRLLDAGKGAAGAFLDNVLEDLIRGLGTEILR
mgnify:FL=1|jgi:hypothetical protein|tara:strand:- start:123 stop:851 length:729 start_codon:yes stop_codon:yes gene_type:complete